MLEDKAYSNNYPTESKLKEKMHSGCIIFKFTCIAFDMKGTKYSSFFMHACQQRKRVSASVSNMVSKYLILTAIL
jgi:hypothetical protein